MFGIILVPIVRLHQARIPRATRGRGGWIQRTAIRLLNDRSEDDAMVHEGSVGSVLDGVVNVLDGFGGVVGTIVEPAAGVLEGVEIGGPHVLERDPFRRGGKIRRVALVVGVAVRAGANAVTGVVDALASRAAGVERGRAVDLAEGGRVREPFLARERGSERNDDDECDDGNHDGEDHYASASTAPVAATTSPVVVVIFLFFNPAILEKFCLVVCRHISHMAVALKFLIIFFATRTVLPR